MFSYRPLTIYDDLSPHEKKILRVVAIRRFVTPGSGGPLTTY
jgi:hypothetical protein